MMEYIVDRMAQQRATGKAPRAVANQSYGGTASNGSYAREAAMQEAADFGVSYWMNHLDYYKHSQSAQRGFPNPVVYKVT